MKTPACLKTSIFLVLLMFGFSGFGVPREKFIQPIVIN